MRTILNVIWLMFAGFWLALGYFLDGIACMAACCSGAMSGNDFLVMLANARAWE
ncbi:hypothetical protein GCM10023196_048100 [Actinoallomurus vinaceus]|uniref:Inner membrane component domain-containing protein n=1 Tax=Actinoallomurus vinaceus TaxID=1080074 RepID=A0ABP8UD12_9ACTN